MRDALIATLMLGWFGGWTVAIRALIRGAEQQLDAYEVRNDWPKLVELHAMGQTFYSQQREEN